jgi:hypothetical protein
VISLPQSASVPTGPPGSAPEVTDQLEVVEDALDVRVPQGVSFGDGVA